MGKKLWVLIRLARSCRGPQGGLLFDEIYGIQMLTEAAPDR